MIQLLVAAALAGDPPPPGVVTDDVFGWQDAADRLLDGPPGCWDVTGTAEQKLVAFVPPDALSNGLQYEEVQRSTVTGQIRDGEWQRFDWTPEDVKAERGSLDLTLAFLPTALRDMSLYPLVGELEEPGGGPTNVVRTILDEWSGDLSVSIAEWDEAAQGVWLRREVPVRRKPRAPLSHVDVFFPGGQRIPTSMDVAFPESFQAGKTQPFRIRVEDGQIHVRATPTGAPTIESASFLFVVMGYTVGYEQTIRYGALTPCGQAKP